MSASSPITPRTSTTLKRSKSLLKNLIRLRATGSRSPARALHKGVRPGSPKAIGAADHGTRSGQCQRRDVVSATASDTTASRHHPASAITLRDLTARDYAVDAEPTMVVRCVVGAMTRLPSRHRSRVLPAIADGRDGVSRRPWPVPSATEPTAPTAEHPLPHQLLRTEKVTQMAGSAVLDPMPASTG